MNRPSIEIVPYEPADVPDVFEAARESVAEMSPWLPWCHAGYRIEESREWVSSRPALFAEGIEYNFAIRDASARFVGGCGLNQIQPLNGVANLGYWVRTSQTGRGIATAGVERLVAFAFDETELVRLEIVCAVDNVGSRRVAEKSGALREATLKDRLWSPGGPRDAVLYAILRSGRHREQRT